MHKPISDRFRPETVPYVGIGLLYLTSSLEVFSFLLILSAGVKRYVCTYICVSQSRTEVNLI